MNSDADVVGPDRRARLLVIYLACGAASGLLVCLMAIAGDQAFASWQANFGDLQPTMHKPELDGLTFSACTSFAFFGILGAIVTVLFAGYWKQIRMPVCAASFWASLAGSFSILALAGDREKLSAHHALFVVMKIFVLGAAYGFTTSLAAQSCERVLKIIRKWPEQ